MPRRMRLQLHLLLALILSIIVTVHGAEHTALPQPSDEALTPLTLNERLKFDSLGPIILNVDGLSLSI